MNRIEFYTNSLERYATILSIRYPVKTTISAFISGIFFSFLNLIYHKPTPNIKDIPFAFFVMYGFWGIFLGAMLAGATYVLRNAPKYEQMRFQEFQKREMR